MLCPDWQHIAGHAQIKRPRHDANDQSSVSLTLALVGFQVAVVNEDHGVTLLDYYDNHTFQILLIKFRIRIHWLRSRLNQCQGLLDTEQDGRMLWKITHDLEVLAVGLLELQTIWKLSCPR